MTGNEFEKYFCQILRANGYWTLNIPKNVYGAQPFDVIAMRGDSVLAIDCKVCSGQARFPLSRIEDNQWTAFEDIYDRTFAWVGIAVLYQEEIYFFQYSELVSALKKGKKSISMDVFHRWMDKKSIEDVMGVS